MDRRIAFDREFDRFKRSYAGDPRHLRMKFITWLNRTGKMEIIRIERKNLTREEYLKMDDVIVVCRKCHYHYHSRRKF
jgi:hypothetical protein